MDDAIQAAVERVIRAMRENLGEQITMDDMARTAMFSKFHFSRIFLRVTGISPGRFLSALRLQEAKRLLRTTSMTVADISHVVGYNSIGTFSSRFRFSVGASPSEYRQYDGLVPAITEAEPDGAPHPGVVRGNIWSTPGCSPGPMMIGLYSGRIAQGIPVRHVTRTGIGPFEIVDVPAGSWQVLAYAADAAYETTDAHGHYVATFGPVTVSTGTTDHDFDMWLRPPMIFDPPALLAHLDPRALTAATAETWDPDRVDEPTMSGA